MARNESQMQTLSSDSFAVDRRLGPVMLPIQGRTLVKHMCDVLERDGCVPRDASVVLSCTGENISHRGILKQAPGTIELGSSMSW
jgi:hypothetical protein